MKNLTQLLFTLFCLCLPAMLQAPFFVHTDDKPDFTLLFNLIFLLLIYFAPVFLRFPVAIQLILRQILCHSPY